MPSAEKKMEKKRDEVRRRIESRLQTSGEQDKIRRHIRIALNTCGWMDDVKSLCVDLIRQRGAENCTVEELVEAILPQVRDKVPKHLKQEVLDMLWKFADTHEIGISDDDDLFDATS